MGTSGSGEENTGRLKEQSQDVIWGCKWESRIRGWMGFSVPQRVPCECDGALAQAARGGCGVSFSGDIQDPPGQGPLQPAVGDPASAVG